MKKTLVFIFLISICFVSSGVFAVGAIDINTASLAQLDTLTGIGPKYAQAIIDARPFSSVDDLIRVKGIGEKTLQKIKEQGLAYVAPQSSPPLVAEQNIQPIIETATEPITAINKLAEVGHPLTYPTGIVLNEILPSPEGADETEEWIEIFNQNNFEVDLSGWKIQDAKGSVIAYTFPENIKIKGLGYLVLKRPETKITLNNTEDGLNLLDPNQKIIDSLFYNTAPRNQSYNKTSSGWVWSDILTPGLLNNISKNQNLPSVKDLPNSKKSDISNKIDEKIKTAGTASINSTKTNPWFLFFTALIITIISTLFVLFIKFKLNKYVRT